MPKKNKFQAKKKSSSFFQAPQPSVTTQTTGAANRYLTGVCCDKRINFLGDLESAAIAGCRDPRTGEPITVGALNHWIAQERIIDTHATDHLMKRSEGESSKIPCRHNPLGASSIPSNISDLEPQLEAPQIDLSKLSMEFFDKKLKERQGAVALTSDSTKPSAPASTTSASCSSQIRK